MKYGVRARTLSSAGTFFLKFIVPVIWIGGLSVATVGALFIGPASFTDSLGIVEELAILLLSCWFFYYYCVPLKEVKTDGNYLYISNFRKTIPVQVSNIEKITEAPFFHTVFIWFKAPTEFGASISFQPYRHMASLFGGPHPVVVELKALAGLQR